MKDESCADILQILSIPYKDFNGKACGETSFGYVKILKFFKVIQNNRNENIGFS